MADVEDILSMPPSWDRVATVAITPEGIEVRICQKEKKVYTIKSVTPSLSKKERQKLQGTCYEVAVDYFARFFRECEIAEIWDWSQKETVICEAKPMSNWLLLNKFTRRKAVWTSKYPIAFKCWELFKAGDEGNFYKTLMEHIRLKELKSGEDALDSYKKYDAFHEVLWKGIYPLIGKPISSDIEQVIKDLHFLPRKIKFQRIDEYRKQDKSRRAKKIKEYEKKREREFSTKYDIPKSSPLSESLPDIPKLHEAERASDLTKWIESIKDPKNQAIARLKSDEPEITVRQIAERLSLSKSGVDRRIKKLKKNNPIF